MIVGTPNFLSKPPAVPGDSQSLTTPVEGKDGVLIPESEEICRDEIERSGQVRVVDAGRPRADEASGARLPGGKAPGHREDESRHLSRSQPPLAAHRLTALSGSRVQASGSAGGL
jgi:hypothetical protein